MENSSIKKFYIKILLAFIVSLSYAILRYIVLGNYTLWDIPLFITNKAISLTAIFLLLFSVFQKTNKTQTSKKIWKIIFILTSIHVFISFRLLGPEHYSKFYIGNEINLFGYVTLFFGITAFVGLLILNSDKFLPTENGKLIIPNYVKKPIIILIPYLIVGHLVSMGFNGWITPNSWNGYLIPISLLAFIAISVYIIKTNRK